MLDPDLFSELRIRNRGCNEIEVILTDLFVFRQHGQPFHRGGRLYQPQLPWCRDLLQQQQPPDRLTHCHRPPGQGQAKAHCLLQCSGSGSVGSVCFWASRIRIQVLQSQIPDPVTGSGSVSGSFPFLIELLSGLKQWLQNKILMQKFSC
jgi:hypothetical protein